MKLLVQSIAAAVSRRPGWTLTIVVLLTLVLGFFASQQEVANDNRAYLPDNETAAAIDEIQQDFETATAIPSQIIVRADNIYDPEVLAEVTALEAQIRADETLGPLLIPDETTQVFSYADALLAAAGGDPNVIGSVPPAELLAQLPEGAAAQVLATTAEQRDEGSAGAALVLANFDFSHPEETIEAAEVELRDLVAAGDYDHIEAQVFNQGVLQEVIDEGQSETGPLFLLAMVLILVVLVVLYRTASDVVLGIVGLIMTVVWMYGIGVLLGPDYLGLVGPFNSMTIIIPVLLVGLAIDYAIHVISRYREEITFDYPNQPRGAIAPAVRAVGAALVLATITTGVGFLTNLASPLPPIQDFGVFTAVGVASAFVVMTTFVPSGRVLLDLRRVRKGKELKTRRVADTVPGARKVLTKVSEIAERYPWPTIAVFGAVTIAALVLTTNLSTTFDNKDFIPQDNEVYDSLVYLEDEFASRGDTATLLVRADMTDPALLGAMAETNAALEEVDGVAGPVQSSVLSVAGDWATQTPQIPDDRFDAEIAAALGRIGEPEGPAQLYDALAAVDPAGLAQTVSVPDFDSGVIVVPLDNITDPEATKAAHDAMLAAAAPLVDAGAEIVPTSEGIVTYEVMDTLRSTQIQSIVTTVIAAALILTLYFGFSRRRPMLGILAVLPVALVIAWILGTMVVLGISFNVLTAMITVLTIGIGVPYSIHVVNRFLEDLERHPNVHEALRATMQHTGGAVLGSAITTILGFGVLVFSSLLPMRQFGGLTAITIFYTLIASVVLLPAVLVLYGRVRRRRDGDFAEPADPDEAASERAELPAGTRSGSNV